MYTLGERTKAIIYKIDSFEKRNLENFKDFDEFIRISNVSLIQGKVIIKKRITESFGGK